jgi:hypothetical protein
MATITIQVDDEVAEAYHSLSPEAQSEIDKIFNLFLREYFSKKGLSEIRIEIAEQAQE